MKTTMQKVFLFIAAFSVSLAVNAAPLAEKEWTFLLFLNGHNNLSSFGDMNIKDMEKTGSNDQVNHVVEWGSDGLRDQSCAVELVDTFRCRHSSAQGVCPARPLLLAIWPTGRPSARGRS